MVKKDWLSVDTRRFFACKRHAIKFTRLVKN